MLSSFTDSYFEISINNNEESANCDYLPCHSTTTSGLTDVNKDAHDVFENLTKARRCNTKSLMCGYLNINSTRNKHEYIRDLLQRNLVDILFLSERKIDASFPDAQFSIHNFTMWRADRNTFGGGVMVYIRSDLAADRKIQYEFREIESIGVEVTSGNEKCFFGGVYKPPSMSNEHFYIDFGQTVDKIISNYDKYIFIGDFNYDMLNCEKSTMLHF